MVLTSLVNVIKERSRVNKYNVVILFITALLDSLRVIVASKTHLFLRTQFAIVCQMPSFEVNVIL